MKELLLAMYHGGLVQRGKKPIEWVFGRKISLIWKFIYRI